jgi:predicted lipoprotein with Yx(FWY)xxD motif
MALSGASASPAFVLLHFRRTLVLKTIGAAVLLASGLVGMAAPAFALQAVVTQIDKNGDGSMTLSFFDQDGSGRDPGPGGVKGDRGFRHRLQFLRPR